MTTVESLQTQINSVIALYSNGQIQEALDSVETLTKDYPNEPLLYNICGVFSCSRTLSTALGFLLERSRAKRRGYHHRARCFQ